jgi:hypothetical protein
MVWQPVNNIAAAARARQVVALIGVGRMGLFILVMFNFWRRRVT